MFSKTVKCVELLFGKRRANVFKTCKLCWAVVWKTLSWCLKNAELLFEKRGAVVLNTLSWYLKNVELLLEKRRAVVWKTLSWYKLYLALILKTGGADIENKKPWADIEHRHRRADMDLTSSCYRKRAELIWNKLRADLEYASSWYGKQSSWSGIHLELIWNTPRADLE